MSNLVRNTLYIAFCFHIIGSIFVGDTLYKKQVGITGDINQDENILYPKYKKIGPKYKEEIKEEEDTNTIFDTYYFQLLQILFILYIIYKLAVLFNIKIDINI